MARFLVALTVLALLLISTGNAKADFINPSFETGDLTGWGGTATTDGYGLNPFGTTYGSGMDGKWWAYMSGFDGPRARTLTQTVGGLTAGTKYAVDFIMASEYVLSDSIFVSADGGAPVQFTAPPYIPGGFNGGFWDNWVSKEFTFTASGTSALITFSTFGLTAPQYDTGLDNIHLKQVPEPSSLILLGVTAAGLCGYTWRRRKQSVRA